MAHHDTFPPADISAAIPSRRNVQMGTPVALGFLNDRQIGPGLLEDQTTPRDKVVSPLDDQPGKPYPQANNDEEHWTNYVHYGLLSPPASLPDQGNHDAALSPQAPFEHRRSLTPRDRAMAESDAGESSVADTDNRSNKTLIHDEEMEGMTEKDRGKDLGATGYDRTTTSTPMEDERTAGMDWDGRVDFAPTDDWPAHWGEPPVPIGLSIGMETGDDVFHDDGESETPGSPWGFTPEEEEIWSKFMEDIGTA